MWTGYLQMLYHFTGFPDGSASKESACQCKTRDMGLIPGLGRPLAEETATHSFQYLVWKIPWIEEPGRLQSKGQQRVRHDWNTHTHLPFYLWDLSIHRFSYCRKVLDLIPCGYQILMPSPAPEHFSHHLWNGAQTSAVFKAPHPRWFQYAVRMNNHCFRGYNFARVIY